MQAEHCPGQWSYRVGPCQGVDLADQLWLSRYILLRVSEVCGLVATLDPNPLPGDWTGEQHPPPVAAACCAAPCQACSRGKL